MGQIRRSGNWSDPANWSDLAVQPANTHPPPASVFESLILPPPPSPRARSQLLRAGADGAAHARRGRGALRDVLRPPRRPGPARHPVRRHPGRRTASHRALRRPGPPRPEALCAARPVRSCAPGRAGCSSGRAGAGAGYGDVCLLRADVRTPTGRGRRPARAPSSRCSGRLVGFERRRGTDPPWLGSPTHQPARSCTYAPATGMDKWPCNQGWSLMPRWGLDLRLLASLLLVVVVVFVCVGGGEDGGQCRRLHLKLAVQF
jgi:hypothetical protein